MKISIPSFQLSFPLSLSGLQVPAQARLINNLTQLQTINTAAAPLTPGSQERMLMDVTPSLSRAGEQWIDIWYLDIFSQPMLGDGCARGPAACWCGTGVQWVTAANYTLDPAPGREAA